jgi:hypothetical protein
MKRKLNGSVGNHTVVALVVRVRSAGGAGDVHDPNALLPAGTGVAATTAGV